MLNFQAIFLHEHKHIGRFSNLHLNKYHTVLCANYRNKKKDQKIIGVSLNSCPKAMRQSDKYQNFLIFIPLPRHLSLKRLNSKTCLIIMHTKMQVISSL